MPTPVWKRSETWGIGIALVTLVLVFFFARQDWVSFQSSRLQVARLQETLASVADVLSTVKDLETGQRGFILVGKAPYLSTYQNAKAVLQTKMARLERLTASEPALRERITRMGELIALKSDELQRTVTLRQTQGFAAALAVVDTDEGKALMDQLRVETSRFLNAGQVQLRMIEQAEDLHRLRAAGIAAGGSALLFFLLVAAAVLVRRQTNARELALVAVASGKQEVEHVRDLLQTTLRSIGDAVITTDADGMITFLNPVAQDLTGWDDACVGRPLDQVFRIINEYSRESVESPVEKVRRTGLVAGLANHTLLLARDGREIPIDDSGAPIRDGQNNTVGFVLVFRDISERRAAENALRESEDRFRTLANAAPVLLWVARPDGNVTFVNRQWLEFTGRHSGDDLKAGWSEQIHPDDLTRVLDARQRALARHASHSFECRLRRSDGAYRFVMCSETPRFEGGGVLAGYVGAWFDITDLKDAQRSLEISEQRFRTLVAGTTSLVWETDAKGAFVAPQPGWESFTGQTYQEYRGFGGYSAIHPDDSPSVAARWNAAVESRRSFNAEFRLWHTPGRQYRHVTSRGIPMMAADGEVVQWIGTITDATERRLLEERLRQAAKLESLGVLAGGIAHDFNNLLVGILGNASLLQSLIDGPEQQEIADQILKAGERAAVLTQQMLAYSGRGRFVVEPTDLSIETGEIVPLVRSSIPRHVDLVLHLAESLPAAELDRAQFQQLVMNLVINGAEAIEGRAGTVTVSTYSQTLGLEEIATQFPAEPIQPGVYVVLEVQDTGHGMDAETQARIFDPFFTTKFTGRGLGLAAVMGIAKGHKGAIQVISSPGSGSTFRFFLPATSAPLAAPAPIESPLVREADKTTILVVDDEDVVRKVAEHALTRHGFQVLLASNGREAIRVLEANRDAIGAIVLDLTMPVMSGEDALVLLRRIRPDIRILASSGYSQSEAARRFGGAIDGFIQKPYSAQNLLTALRSMLHGGAAGAGMGVGG